MGIMKVIIEKAKEFVEKETKKAVRRLFHLANVKGQELAEKLDADKDIVMLGTLLMDVKLKQAMEENRLKDHVKMSLEAAKEFLKQFDLSEETKNKIYNCIEAHHGNVSFICIEAEICANADCYKFLHPKGVLQYIGIMMGRTDDFQEVIANVEKKLEEKHKILSLDICKEELEHYYKMFKELFEKARE